MVSLKKTKTKMNLNCKVSFIIYPFINNKQIEEIENVVIPTCPANRSNVKVIGIGLSRIGTTSLTTALNMAGISSYHALSKMISFGKYVGDGYSKGYRAPWVSNC